AEKHLAGDVVGQIAYDVDPYRRRRFTSQRLPIHLEHVHRPHIQLRELLAQQRHRAHVYLDRYEIRVALEQEPGERARPRTDFYDPVTWSGWNGVDDLPRDVRIPQKV